VIGCGCGHATFVGALYLLEKYLPVVKLDFSNPTTTKITLTHALSGEIFIVEDVTSDVALTSNGKGTYEGSF